MESKKVFLVYYTDFIDEMELIEGIFDNYDDAAAFTKRFKENSRFEISERPLNPIYETNKTQSPYYVRFLIGSSEPIDAYIADYSEGVESAMTSEFIPGRYSKSNDLFDFSQYLFADNLEDAIDKVRENRDKFVASQQLKDKE